MALFPPFFLGQVVRAYGWLILLGKRGLNATLAGAGLPTVQLIYTYPGVLIGLVQYMLPFAVLLLAPALTAIPRDRACPRRAWVQAGPPRSATSSCRWRSRASSLPGSVFTLTLTDFAMPEIMGGGGNDFIANAVYDAFFQLNDAGMDGAMGVALTLLGTLLVGIAFTLAGLGTLAYVQRRAA